MPSFDGHLIKECIPRLCIVIVYVFHHGKGISIISFSLMHFCCRRCILCLLVHFTLQFCLHLLSSHRHTDCFGGESRCPVRTAEISDRNSGILRPVIDILFLKTIRYSLSGCLAICIALRVRISACRHTITELINTTTVQRAVLRAVLIEHSGISLYRENIIQSIMCTFAYGKIIITST